MRLNHTRAVGFTFIELLVASVVAGIALFGGYALVNSALSLYAKNFSLNRSHYTGRVSLEKVTAKIYAAGAAPILTDKTGADVAGNGPAAGIRFCVPATGSAYTVVNAVSSTQTSAVIQIATGQPLPRASDILLIDAGSVVQTGNIVQVELTTVGGGSDASRVNVTFRDAPGSSIPANTRCLVLQQSAFVAVGGELRFYPTVMSVARQGGTVFNNPANFSVISTVEPIPGETEAKPFAYSTAARRLLSVNLRNRSSKYAHRVGGFSSFFNIRSSIAIKSTYLDPSKLKAIN
jgi:prepilin-type N-terminal cleavage/methylation domain-containing protein